MLFKTYSQAFVKPRFMIKLLCIYSPLLYIILGMCLSMYLISYFKLFIRKILVPEERICTVQIQ